MSTEQTTNQTVGTIGTFILASLASSYPDNLFNADVKTLLEDEEIQLPSDLRALFTKVLADESHLDDLRSEYIALFDSGRGIAPLYETEYGRNRSFFKANELSDLAGFYKAFGFELGNDETAREMLDHIAVELEFYALLGMKLEYLNEIKDEEGIAIVMDARRKFLKDHLGRFTAAILERPGVVDSTFYGPIFKFINELVERECLSLEVKPDRVNWLGSEQEAGEIACGGTLPNLQ